MVETLEKINSAVWGVPMLLLMLGVGILISIRTKFIQLRLFPKAIKAFVRQFYRRGDAGEGSSYRALCTALAATAGTGNLAGVAGAIAIGGPGAVFWMWVCAFVGMATKFAEATLAVRYRNRRNKNDYIGGPMYIIVNGLKNKWHILAYAYCFLGLLASFGVGNATQINTVICGIESIAELFNIKIVTRWKVIIGCLLAIMLVYMLLGGAKRIGDVTELLMPIVSLGYMLMCIFVLIIKIENIPLAVRGIIYGAFSPKAVTGGTVGSALLTLRIGVSRGVFTNESGMGTASIAHASGNVEHPVQQGLMGIVEVFIDTILMCTMTALVILCSDIVIPYGTDTGMALTVEAFSSVCGLLVRVPLAIAVCLLAIATVLGWGLYGARCAEFLFGSGAWKYFSMLQGLAAIVGAVLQTGTIWLLADIVNGLMAIPNLIALFLLTPELVRLTNSNARTKSSGV